ncbi:MAG: ABC transporter substrate-binding protein [Alphaproteobacteria bacterium]|nr:ABC transporter substrate-binding protein [Alphaproteobacteria bacterium]
MKAGLFSLSLACVVGLFQVFPAEGKDLRIIAPNIPPHFDESGKGRIGDVIAATLARCGHRVSFTMVPFGRHWKDYTDIPGFDGLATAEADQTFPGFTTMPFIHLQDGATVLAHSRLKGITSVTQLHGRRVIAFPNAENILGIQSSVARFESFKTRSNRFDQIRPLFAGRIDAVLADGLITARFIGVLRENAKAGKEPGIDAGIPVVFRKIFPPGPQRLYFRDRRIARDFDTCFKALRADGSVARITRPYVDRYRAVLGNQYPDF